MMNDRKSSSIFSGVPLAPRDATMGITELFNADARSAKVNLGVGMYCDEDGKVPLLRCVQEAEARLVKGGAPKSYLGIDGVAAYNNAVKSLLFGAESSVVRENRAVTVQSLGGSGALKVGADFLARFGPSRDARISEPTWENHRTILEQAGFSVSTYPYYDAHSHASDFAGMMRALEAMAPGTVVILQACCHNPTGADLMPWQWQAVVDVVDSRRLVPFLDVAYQGFGEGLEADGAVVREFARRGMPLFVASSSSKSFSLYGERIGALTILSGGEDESGRVLSQVKRVIRANYSSPPTHGARIVATILDSPDLAATWRRDLDAMRERVQRARKAFVGALKARAPSYDFDFMLHQRGLFSYSGLTREQVISLRTEHSVYAIENGRICIAALNSRNIEYVADSVARVLGS